MIWKTNYLVDIILKGLHDKIIFLILYLLRVRFLNVGVWAIGHLATDVDCYIKDGVMRNRQKYIGIVLTPPDKVANKHLLDYWKKYLIVLTDGVFFKLLKPFSTHPALPYNVDKYSSTINKTAEIISISNKWNSRWSLLSLSSADKIKGAQILKKLGIPENAWFVCIHCRESGYCTPGRSEEILKSQWQCQSYRDVHIDAFIPAMQTIVEKGGWCIRMGDSTMQKLPQLDHVIDYAHTGLKSDFMDVFLCASCRFFLGSNSGLASVSYVFGIPCIMTNISPMSAVFYLGKNDLAIPKLVWSEDKRQLLSFSEIMSTPIGNYRFGKQFTESRIKLIDNEPDEIIDLVLEMYSFVKGEINYTESEEYYQRKFKSLFKDGHYSYGARSRVGRDFLKKYSHLCS